MGEGDFDLFDGLALKRLEGLGLEELELEVELVLEERELDFELELEGDLRL